MVLTDNGKEYIAKNFGIGNCFVESGLQWTSVGYEITTVDADGNVTVHEAERVEDTGGTKNLVGRLVNTMVYAKIELNQPRTGTFTNAQLVGANDGQIVTLPDVATIGFVDGGVGETQYCVTAVTPPPVVTPPPTATPDFEKIVGTYDFSKMPCTGDPTGGIIVPEDISMGQELSQVLNKQWFWINGVKITNTSACIAFFGVEMRMWAGVRTSCGTKESAVWKGMNRNVEEEFIRLIPIEPGETVTMYLDFFVPPATLGVHTICLYVWGNFSKYDLGNELEVEGYSNPEIAR